LKVGGWGAWAWWPCPVFVRLLSLVPVLPISQEGRKAAAFCLICEVVQALKNKQLPTNCLL